MKKIIITLILLLNIFVSTIYCQENESISIRLTEELEKICTRGYINGFAVAIVNQNRILYEK